jgi:hypothetical protein
MKKRAHIPHNYEKSFEIRQEGHVCRGYQPRKAEQCIASTDRCTRRMIGRGAGR